MKITEASAPRTSICRASHIDLYLERLGYWKQHRPASSTARLLAARDADEAHPLRSEEEATVVVEYLWRLEREQPSRGQRERA
jgi:hypothetical protein